ncbi:MAG: tetratricopeptide repeat protein, partial [Planctomycetes bacterium]|nr:tetratricopeptide repeat protein [Planctomycetota bacterium]
VAEQLAGALEAHQRGDLDAAECRYRNILERDPHQPDALHLLGVTELQRQRHDAAAQLIRRAISANPQAAAFYSNLAAALQAQGRLDEAAEALEQAVGIEPDFADAWLNLGLVHSAAGRWVEGVRALRRAVELRPESNEIRLRFADAQFELGLIHQRACRFVEAAAAYESAICGRPTFASAHSNLGAALERLGEFERAHRHFLRAVELEPDFPEAQLNLGNSYRQRGEIDSAIRCYDRALEARPVYRDAAVNRGVSLVALGRIDDAIAGYEQAMVHHPESPLLHFNRALAWLTAGDFARGWREYDWRWRYDAVSRGLAEPEWDGSPLPAGRTLFVHAEQGVGDEIMFASCLPDVLARTGACVVDCDPRLVPLFQRSFPAARVFAAPQPRTLGHCAELPSFDVQIAAGSLPRLFRPTLDCFPAGRAWLTPDACAVSRWRERYRALGEGLKVGISWRGGGKRDTIIARSTGLVDWKPVLDVPGIRFVNLQYGDCRQELDELRSRAGHAIHDWGDADPLCDLDDFASQIAALDLVISVDNSTVHMAGALGVPVWTLLPIEADWRWLRDRETSPWYPSMRLFRRCPDKGWPAVFELIAAQLAHGV